MTSYFMTPQIKPVADIKVMGRMLPFPIRQITFYLHRFNSLIENSQPECR